MSFLHTAVNNAAPIDAPQLEESALPRMLHVSYAELK